MKQILLVGDSISIGYRETVRQTLAGQAEVWFNEANSEDSRNLLRYQQSWFMNRPADLIHFNCGLHDLKRPFDAAGPEGNQVPLPEYRQNLEALLETLQSQHQAQLVFALTTPVNETWHQANKSFARFNSDVAAYNAAATEICRRLNVPINNLHETVTATGRDRILVEDGVHYTNEGYILLGQAVATYLHPFIQTQ